MSKTLLGRIKLVLFELLYVIHSNRFNNKHILAIIDILQLLPLVFFYINPLFLQLDNMHVFRQFHQKVWPQIVLFIPNQQAIISVILLLSFPCILIALFLMKTFIGYQYILIVVIELFLLLYPLVFLKFTIDSIDLIIDKPDYRFLGIVLSLIHIIGSLGTFHLYSKKHKIIDFLLILLINLKANQYAIFALITLRLGFIYLLSQKNILKQLKINIELSLLLILLFSFLTTDVLTNYISFLFIFIAFSISPLLHVLQHYDQYQNLVPEHYDNVFFHLNQIENEPNINKIKFYDFLQQHLRDCLNLNCSCRKLLKIKITQEFKKSALHFLNTLYSFRQDFQARIQYARICSSHFSHQLSGLLHTFQHSPQGLYQQYQLYSIIKSYQQEYRRGDKNYRFGESYQTVYEDLRQFEQKIENITIILRDFWLTILEFDGSRKFLSMILSISEQINEINVLFNVYVDKYEEYSHYFLYLYKTFQLVILNSNSNNQDFQQGIFMSIGLLKTQQKIKVPERMVFFVADQKTLIINSNRQFCNLVEIDKQELLNKSYNMFVPKYCQQHHNFWVDSWFNNCNKDQQFTQTIKPLQMQNNFIKSVKILTKILPRFDKGLETITFIKLINQLTHSNNKNHKLSLTESSTQNKDEQQDEDFFTFLIQSQTMKITTLDESFFQVIKIDQSQELRKKILSLKLNEIFPKFNVNYKKQGKKEKQQHLLQENLNQTVVVNKQKQSKDNKEVCQYFPKEVMLNFSVLQQCLDLKQNNKVFGFHQNYLKGVNMKESTQHTFMYEIIQQKNTDLETQYSIVHFKHKNKQSQSIKEHKIPTKLQNNKNFDRGIKKEKGNFKDTIKQDEQKDQIIESKNQKRRTSKQSQRSRKVTIIPNVQSDSSVIGNLAYREGFIRSSKPFKQQCQNGDDQVQKSSSLNESVELSSRKSYCLPWAIIFPLVIIHILYTYSAQYHSSTIEYLSETFQFYDKYEMTILRQLNVTLGKDINYLQQLKQLWIQGHGFYQDSLLIFEDHTANDQYLINRLYSTVIQHNHYGIYQQISSSFQHQQQIATSLYLAIILTLSTFMLYILIDFIFNLRYCFNISAQVTDIVLIFLNISQKDIKKLIISIDHYQQTVLQINDYALIKNMIKRQEDSYGIDERQAEETSVIGLLKVNSKFPSSLIRQDRVKNLDSLFNSPLKSEESKIKSYIDEEKILNLALKDNQRTKRRTLLRKRKTTRLQKINIDKLRENISFLQQSQHQNDIISPIGSDKLILKKKSSFNKDTQQLQLQQSTPQFKYSQKLEPTTKENEEYFDEHQLSKLQKISKFKDQFRGRLNDIRQHPYLYGILLLGTLIAIIVLLVSIVIMPEFVTTFKTFQHRYFDLRAMKVVIFKQLIQKLTNQNLLPEIKPSIYSQHFYANMQDSLQSLPKFQQFWQNVYTNDVCPLISDKQIQSMCLSIWSETTAYGQKIMFQFLQDLLKRLNASQLFSSSSQFNVSQFIKVVNLQLYMISQGQKLMKHQMLEYRSSIQKIEMALVIVGTIFLTLCVFLSRKALNDILSKIKDGQNLLLVMPQNIKNKYIQQVKNNKSIQQIKQLKKEHKQKNRKARRMSSILKGPQQSRTPQRFLYSPKTPEKQLKSPQEQPQQQSALQLIVNNSSLLNKDQEQLLQNSLKNPTQLKLNSVIKNNKKSTQQPTFIKSKFSH